MTDVAAARRRMVEEQIAGRGIRHPAVLRAMGTVPRERFVPELERPYAYDDHPLPIGEGQTISQPYVVALMIEALDPEATDRVLEVGTGTGYSAAVLAEIVAEVCSVERLPGLAAAARSRLDALGYGRVHVHVGDGTLGWPEHAPFDAIVVTAGGPEVPPPLLDQLRIGARLVMPVGQSPRLQQLVRVIRRGESEYDRVTLGEVAFVPLIGAAAWPEARPAGWPPA